MPVIAYRAEWQCHTSPLGVIVLQLLCSPVLEMHLYHSFKSEMLQLQSPLHFPTGKRQQQEQKQPDLSLYTVILTRRYNLIFISFFLSPK